MSEKQILDATRDIVLEPAGENEFTCGPYRITRETRSIGRFTQDYWRVFDKHGNDLTYPDKLILKAPDTDLHSEKAVEKFILLQLHPHIVEYKKTRREVWGEEPVLVVRKNWVYISKVHKAIRLNNIPNLTMGLRGRLSANPFCSICKKETLRGITSTHRGMCESCCTRSNAAEYAAETIDALIERGLIHVNGKLVISAKVVDHFHVELSTKTVDTFHADLSEKGK